MKAKEGLLDLVNNFLTNELTAINQYFIHAEVCAHWGYERLKHKFMENSVEEMRHAQRVSHLRQSRRLQELWSPSEGAENIKHRFHQALQTIMFSLCT